MLLRTAVVLALCAVLAAGQQGPDIKLMTCSAASSANQAWDFTGPANEIRLKSNMYCIDVEGYSTTPGSEVYTYQCHPNDPAPDHQNESWNITSSGTIVEIMSGLCLSAPSSDLQQYTSISIYNCNGQSYQKWYVNQTDSTIRPTNAPNLCLDGGSPNPRACDIPPGINLPFCNTSLDFETRAWDIVNRLTTQEKIPLFSNGAGAVPRLNIPNYQWWSEALHGVGGSPGVNFRAPTPAATSFPQVIHTGATFNKTLWNMIGQTISTEARAMNNVGNAGLTFWAPNINTIPDPRWGRGQETPGEDPYATGMYAANFVTGMQQGEDMNYLKVSSCSKHFYDYNLENWNGMDRHHFNAISSDRDLSDSYLPMFESSVRYGQASALMCSYNEVNGVPSCVNSPLMTVIARQSWGFQGYITGDCGAVDDVIDTHHYYNTSDQVSNGVLSAGLDVDCGGYLNGNLLNAINDGSVTNSTVNEALFHLFTIQMRLGMFDPLENQVYTKYTPDMVNTPAHQQLALEASQQGMTLLTNNNYRLPLSAGSVRSIALIGPNADATGTMQGNYAGNAPFLISPQQGIETYVNNVTLVKGCSNVACTDTSGFAAAVTAAAAADVVVMVVGIDQSQEAEGMDRYIVTLPGSQNQLIQQVAAAAKQPIVLVVMTGGALDFGAAAANPKVGAVVWCGYPGQAGGQAIADVIFGTYNPGGRLPYTLYPGNFVNVANMLDRYMRPNTTSGNPGRTYRFYTGTPVFEYGSGLSYTTFTYTNSSASEMRMPLEFVNDYIASIEGKHRYTSIGAPFRDSDVITITVTNTGSIAGADVVQCFISSPLPGLDGNPIKQLIGFERVFLQPQQSVTLQFPVTPHDVTVLDEKAVRKTIPGVWKVSFHHQGKLVVPVTVA